MKKGKLLLSLGDFPFPARKNGYSIRYFPIIEHFSKLYDMEALVFCDWPVGDEHVEFASKYFSKISIFHRQNVSLNIWRKLLIRLIAFLPGAKPYECVRYDQKLIDEFLAGRYAGRRFDLVVCASVSMVESVQSYVAANRWCLDVIDSPYALSSRVAKGFLQRDDAFLMGVWERKIVKSVDCACYISPLDRQIGCGNNFDSEKIKVIPNGVYLEDLTSDRVHFEGLTIGYLGHMGYEPNILAAERLYRLFKQVQRAVPDLRLVIIGRDPDDRILALAQDSAVTVTGTVDNIWPFVNAMDFFVFPMITGSGQQNKLLEAMAAKKAVISTNLGNSGVGAIHKHSILVADSDEEIISAMNQLLQNVQMRDEIAISGFSFVKEKYSWPAVFNVLEHSIFEMPKDIPNI